MVEERLFGWGDGGRKQITLRLDDGQLNFAVMSKTKRKLTKNQIRELTKKPQSREGKKIDALPSIKPEESDEQ
jgi:hypothetical protein